MWHISSLVAFWHCADFVGILPCLALTSISVCDEAVSPANNTYIYYCHRRHHWLSRRWFSLVLLNTATLSGRVSARGVWLYNSLRPFCQGLGGRSPASRRKGNESSLKFWKVRRSVQWCFTIDFLHLQLIRITYSSLPTDESVQCMAQSNCT